MARSLFFIAYGTAQPAGSKRGFQNPKMGRIIITDDNPKSRPWKNQVAQAAGVAMAAMEGAAFLDGPLRAEFRFVVARPKGHFKKDGRLNAAGLRNPYPAKRPDCLKLTRGAEDAMSKVVYRDDSQIVQEVIQKEWGVPERVEVEITELTGESLLPPSEFGAVEF